MKQAEEFFTFKEYASIDGYMNHEAIIQRFKDYAKHVLDEAAESLVDCHTDGGHQIDADEKSILKLKEQL